MQDGIFTFGLLLLTAGFFWAWPPLGLIVPGTVICGVMIWSRMHSQKRGDSHAEPADAGAPSRDE